MSKAASKPLPPPLPPETRTVGQLVAEAIRLYGRRFWRALTLGIAPALLAVAAAEFDGVIQWLVVLGLGPLVLAATLVGAVAIAHDVSWARVGIALVAGVLAFAPLVFARLYVFPGIYLVALAWFALTCLSVPAVLIEGRGLRNALGRSVALARADFVHALGALATLVIVVVLSMFVLFSTLRTIGDQGSLAATTLVFLLLAPVFFLGTALLYFDQAARVGSGPRARRS